MFSRSNTADSGLGDIAQYKWMWGDAGTRRSPFGHQAAMNNPFRWSKYLTRQECIRTLKASSNDDRPVRLRGKSDNTDVTFPKIGEAIRHLEKEIEQSSFPVITDSFPESCSSNFAPGERTNVNKLDDALRRRKASEKEMNDVLQERAKEDPMKGALLAMMSQKMCDIIRVNNDALLSKVNESMDRKLEALRSEVHRGGDGPTGSFNTCSRYSLQTVASGEPLLTRLSLPADSDAEVEDMDRVPVFLRVECKEKSALEDFYELQSFTKNGRPVWSDGQNFLYCTSNMQWAIAMDEDGVNGDRGWLYDDKGGAELKYPDAVVSWNLYDGANWNRTDARVYVSPPPSVNVQCQQMSDVNGNYRLMNPEDDTPMWGNGKKRLYLNMASQHWALCLSPATTQQGGGVVRSGANEKISQWPNMIREWEYHTGARWEKCTTRVTATKRPPPKHLVVNCGEKPELNGVYSLLKENINDVNAWCDGDNYIYQTTTGAWAVCIGRKSTENDRGWMYAKLRETKFPDKVQEWHVYDGKDWNYSASSSVQVPENDKSSPPAMPVYRPDIKEESKTGIILEAPEPAPASNVTASAVIREAPARMCDASESDCRIMPNTAWNEIKPSRPCVNELTENPGIRTSCGDIDSIVKEVKRKIHELERKSLPVKLEADYLAAIVTYTHDLERGSKKGNVYFELNQSLRVRDPDQRQKMMDVWGNYVHYLIMGLGKLPEFSGICFRGYPDKDSVLSEYQLGRPIQWGAFASVTTSWETAKAFTDQTTGVIFKIAVTSGRQIADYSFFPAEDEVLLMPSHRFTVASEPYESDGFMVVYLVQQRKAAFIS